MMVVVMGQGDDDDDDDDDISSHLFDSYGRLCAHTLHIT